MVTGESTKDTVKTIVQGMPAVAVYPWLLTPVLFVAHAASGATRIRHSLRPLLISRAVRFQQLGHPVPRECGCMFPVIASEAKQSRVACSALDCFAEPVIGRRFAPTRWLAMTANGTISDPHDEEARKRGLRTMRSLSSGARLRDPLASPGE